MMQKSRIIFCFSESDMYDVYNSFPGNDRLKMRCHEMLTADVFSHETCFLPQDKIDYKSMKTNN